MCDQHLVLKTKTFSMNKFYFLMHFSATKSSTSFLLLLQIVPATRLSYLLVSRN